MAMRGGMGMGGMGGKGGGPKGAPDDSVIGQAYDSRLMRRMLAYLKPYGWQVASAVVLLLAGTAAELAGPLVVKYGIDHHIAGGDIAGLGKIVLLFLGLLLAGTVLRYYQAYLTAWIGERVVLDLRTKLYDHLQRLDVKTIDSRPVGWWMTRVTNDVQTLNEMFSSVVVSVFGDLFALFGIVMVMLWMNFKLAMATFIVLPILIWVVSVFRRAVRNQFRAIREALAKLNGFMQEQISGVRTVQLFGGEKRAEVEFHDHNIVYRNAYLKTIRYYALFFPAVTFISALASALILLTGGLMIRGSVLTWGSLVAFLQYAERFFRPIRDLSERYNTMQAAMAAAERVFWLLDLESESCHSREGGNPDKSNLTGQPAIIRQLDSRLHGNNKSVRGEIVFENVNFEYKPGDPILKEVSFRVEPGSTVAVVGATGAGKTTLISLLLRFWDVNSGRIMLDGKDLRDYPLADLRRFFGVVQQDTFLFSGTVADNVTLGEDSRNGEILRNALVESGASSFVDRLPKGVAEEVGERGARISGGEKQLLSIARALAANPPLMLLDEATAAIDSETEHRIQEAFERLMVGRTTLVIAHRLSTIRKAAKILVMHKGRIQESGAHDELLELNGLYAKLYRLQFAEAA